jgi:hypothetical protein
MDATERLAAVPLFDGLSVAQQRMIARLFDGTAEVRHDGASGQRARRG